MKIGLVLALIIALGLVPGCATDMLFGEREISAGGDVHERGIDLAFAWGTSRTEPSNTAGGQMSEIFNAVWTTTMGVLGKVFGRGDTINQSFEGVERVEPVTSDSGSEW